MVNAESTLKLHCLGCFGRVVCVVSTVVLAILSVIVLFTPTDTTYVASTAQGRFEANAHCGAPIGYIIGKRDLFSGAYLTPPGGKQACSRQQKRELAIGVTLGVSAGLSFIVRRRFALNLSVGRTSPSAST